LEESLSSQQWWLEFGSFHSQPFAFFSFFSSSSPSSFATSVTAQKPPLKKIKNLEEGV
jgi:hypothetical protein